MVPDLTFRERLQVLADEYVQISNLGPTEMAELRSLMNAADERVKVYFVKEPLLGVLKARVIGLAHIEGKRKRQREMHALAKLFVALHLVPCKLKEIVSVGYAVNTLAEEGAVILVKTTSVI